MILPQRLVPTRAQARFTVRVPAAKCTHGPKVAFRTSSSPTATTNATTGPKAVCTTNQRATGRTCILLFAPHNSFGLASSPPCHSHPYLLFFSLFSTVCHLELSHTQTVEWVPDVQRPSPLLRVVIVVFLLPPSKLHTQDGQERSPMLLNV
ncbi:hypothetical protein TRVL_01161 [Trypanosoma vivax]|nr:hypothetical protein TRVL_01161 [Trypanosoma vivax]